MKLARSVACIATALCFAIPAVAQQSGTQSSGGATSGSGGGEAGKKSPMRVKKGQTRKQTFDRMDTNKDGMISTAEAQADPALVILFVDADTNADGQLTPAEFVVIPITDEAGVVIK